MENVKREVLLPEVGKPFDPADYGYTAHEKWEYRQLIYKEDYEQPWIDLAVSFYRGAYALIDGVVNGHLLEDVEGVAGVFMFRHFLELILKQIVLRGRLLETEDHNAAWDQVKRVANEHKLSILWKWVQQDARPKMKAEAWDGYDVLFAEKIIAEFDAVDPKGFAFRYHGQGGQNCKFSYAAFLVAMEHARQSLDGILGYLTETYGENAEWEDILRSEAGY